MESFQMALYKQQNTNPTQRIYSPEEIYVIHLPGGLYWEKLYLRQRTQFFPIPTKAGK